MKSSAKLTFEAILVVAVVLAVLFTPMLAEASHHGSGPPALEEFDSDGDGFLTEEEFTTGRTERHAEMAKEGKKMKGMASAPTFADFDTDGDGKLTADEFAAGHSMHHEKMQGQEKVKGKHKGHGDMHGKQAGKREHATFEEIDLNGDGCIDQAEMDAHHATEK